MAYDGWDCDGKNGDWFVIFRFFPSVFHVFPFRECFNSFSLVFWTA